VVFYYSENCVALLTSLTYQLTKYNVVKVRKILLPCKDCLTSTRQRKAKEFYFTP